MNQHRNLAKSVKGERGEVLNQDPWWRSRVLPLFTFDPENPDERPVGLGTTFRVDPFGNAATVFHVIEDLISINGNELIVAANQSLVALDMPEGAYCVGRFPIPKEWWRPLHGLVAHPIGVETSPLIHVSTKVRNLSELALLGLLPLVPNRAPYLPVKLRGSMPGVGEVLTAYGFAELDVGRFEDDAISQYLYSFSGPVIEIIAADFNSSRPWPRAVVEAHWPAGMSGGPVVNAQGEVVGIVSTSFEGADCSVAHIFAGWNVPESNFPTLDPSNPGWFHGLAAIDGTGVLRFFGHDPEEVEQFASSNGCIAKVVSLSLANGDWIASELAFPNSLKPPFPT